MKGMSDLDEKGQLKVKVSKNPFQAVWSKLTKECSAEKLKVRLIRKYGLGITTRSFENYVYGNSFPLRFAHALIEESGEQKIWDALLEEAIEFCYRSTLGGKTSWVKLPKDMNSDLAYLAGAMRDGYINMRIGVVAVVQKTCEQWLQETIKPIFQRLFGVEVSIYSNKALIYSYPIAYFLCAVLEHPPGRQTKWGTPKVLFDVPDVLKAAYIRGYFDSEGTSDLNRLRIKISQSWHDATMRPPSLLDMKIFLKSMGIKSSVEGPYFNNGTYSSNIVIYCKENPLNAILFFKKIGSFHPGKKRHLKKLYFKSKSRLARSQKLA